MTSNISCQKLFSSKDSTPSRCLTAYLKCTRICLQIKSLCTRLVEKIGEVWRNEGVESSSGSRKGNLDSVSARTDTATSARDSSKQRPSKSEDDLCTGGERAKPLKSLDAVIVASQPRPSLL
eukprot:6177513-Pleurochrysis_carterae.AAC.3